MTERRRNPISKNTRRVRASFGDEALPAIDPTALKRLKARRGRPPWVTQDYIDGLRRMGTWWHIYQRLPEPSWWTG